MRIAIIAITTRSSMSVKPRREVIHRPFREIRRDRGMRDSMAGSRGRTGSSSSGEERLAGGIVERKGKFHAALPSCAEGPSECEEPRGGGGDPAAGFGQTGNGPVDKPGIAAASAGTSGGVPA